MAGTVIDAETGRPLSNADVSLVLLEENRGRQRWSERATADGFFAFVPLPPGRYSLSASAPGYRTGSYRQRFPGAPGDNLFLAPGERRVDAVLRLWRHAVIAGTVRDERGDPLVGVKVRALSVSVVGGRRSLTANGVATTDDRGQYRMPGLSPGEYVVAVPASTRQPAAVVGPMHAGGDVDDAVGHPTIFFPGSLSPADADVLSLGPGAERDGVDFAVALLPGVSVSGTVINRRDIEPLEVRLVPRDAPDLPQGFEVDTSRSAADGTFTFRQVPRGDYVIQVRDFPRFPGNRPPPGTQQALQGDVRVSIPVEPVAPLPPGPTLWADVPVTVADEAVHGLPVPLQSGARISGRVIFRGAGSRPSDEQLARTPLMVQSADGLSLGLHPYAAIGSDGTFATVGLPPGKYVVWVFGPPGEWSLESVTASGREIAGGPVALGTANVEGLVVTLTDRPASVRGHVTDGKGNVVPEAMVYAFPVDRRWWTDYGPAPLRLRETSASASGAYAFDQILPGEYYVVALSDPAAEPWRLQDTLLELAGRAVRALVGPGIARTVDLKVSTGR